MAINFPLREGRKKDEVHLAQGVARIQGLQGVLSAIWRAAYDAGLAGDLSGQGNGGTQWLETRLVVLPRFQGIGLGTKLPELVAAQRGAYGLCLMSKTKHSHEGCQFAKLILG